MVSVSRYVVPLATIYLFTIENRERKLQSPANIETDGYIYIEIGRCEGRWWQGHQAVVSGGGVRRCGRHVRRWWQWLAAAEGMKPGRKWVSTAAPLCSLLCNNNRAKTKGEPVSVSEVCLIHCPLTGREDLNKARSEKFDFLIPDDEARSVKFDLLISDNEARSVKFDLLISDDEARSVKFDLLISDDEARSRRFDLLISDDEARSVDLLIPDDEARSERGLIFSSLTIKQDLLFDPSAPLMAKQDLNSFDLLISDDEVRSEKFDLLISDNEARSEKFDSSTPLMAKQDLNNTKCHFGAFLILNVDFNLVMQIVFTILALVLLLEDVFTISGGIIQKSVA
ncbi:hypothetical protein GQ457_12G006990 [Hibiscus cannabinus]